MGDTTPGDIQDQEPKRARQARNLILGCGCLLLAALVSVGGCIALTQVYDQNEGQQIEQPGPEESQRSSPVGD